MARMDRIGPGARATTIERRPLYTSVTYHSTKVVEVRDGVVTLNSGGWMTATTKARMNQAANQFSLGYSVASRQGQWIVTLDSGAMLAFHDGMRFNDEGEV